MNSYRNLPASSPRTGMVACPLAGNTVTLWRQVFRVSGIGGPAGISVDVQCSRENDCAHRGAPACPARRLAEG